MWDPNKSQTELRPSEVLSRVLQTCARVLWTCARVLRTAGIVGAILLVVGVVAYLGFVFLKPAPATPTVVIASIPKPTPEPTATAYIAPGKLEFGKFSVVPRPECGMRADFQVFKGGLSVSGKNAVSIELYANGKSIQYSLEFANASYQLESKLPELCSAPGLLKFVARMGTFVTVRHYYVNGWKVPNIDRPTIGNMQVDADLYPEMVMYFGARDGTGNAIELVGVSSVQVFQDETEVYDLALTSVDTTIDPVTVALVIDVSGSMSGTPLTSARQAATEFINTLSENDSICVYSFSTSVKQVLKCTRDQKAGVAALTSLQATGNTALYQVISTVAQDQTSLTGRQAIIVLSDGADTASKVGLQDALAKIKQTNIPVYTIGLVNKDLNSAVLRQIASTTSGSYLEAPRNEALKALYAQIQGQLKHQYRIGFRSIYPERKSGTVALRLSIGDVTVDANRSFFAK